MSAPLVVSKQTVLYICSRSNSKGPSNFFHPFSHFVTQGGSEGTPQTAGHSDLAQFSSEGANRKQGVHGDGYCGMETSDLVQPESKQDYTESELGHSTDRSSGSFADSTLSSCNASNLLQSNGSSEYVTPSSGIERGEFNLSDSVLSISPGHSPGGHVLKLPRLSIETEQPQISTLQSPLIKSLISPTVGTSIEAHRPALFDDHVASSYVPGSLHLAPDSTIERLVQRLGAIPLVRQLAEDLAHRDRELVIFRLKADDRERALKKMLVEVEVSNADIEKRLAACLIKNPCAEGSSDRSGDEAGCSDSINDMIQQALDEEDTFSVVDSASILNFEDDNGDHCSLITPKATLRGKAKAIPTDASSVRSAVTQNSSKIRRWKDYFWGMKPDEGKTGNRARASSVSSTVSTTNTRYDPIISSKRIDAGSVLPYPALSPVPSAETPYDSVPAIQAAKRLPCTLDFHQNRNFNEPLNSRFKAAAMAAESTSGSSSATLVHQKRPDKAASLALKLVADARFPNGYTTPSTSTSPVNTRAMRSRQASKSAHQQPQISEFRSGGVRDDLQRIIARNATKTGTSHRQRTTSVSSANSTRQGPFGNTRLTTSAKDKAPGMLQASQHPVLPDASLGPVEMDMIVPHAVQPPTLLQSWNEHYPADYLTDRFGFIYDKRQRSRSVNSTQTQNSGTEDVTVHSTTPELHAQDGQDTTSECPCQVRTVQSPAMSSEPSMPPQRQASSILERMTRHSTSAVPPPPTRVLSEVPLALRDKSGSSTVEESTIRLLLRQLSDMHESLQRDRSIKWNEFLRKVREERRRGEAEEHRMPEVLMADGELIGVSTLGNSGKGGKQRWKEFRRLVLGGVPVSYRWKVWTECSGAGALRVPGYYDELLQAGNDDKHIMSQISMDINRTLTDNIFFRKGPGVHKLEQVLIAYSRRNPAVGYCQGMNMIAASLLLITPTEEDAFWVLVSIVENILPKTYFEPSLLASRADQIVLKEYVKEILPHLHAHLHRLGVVLEALTFQWFLSIFTDCLAGEALFRVWDVLLCVEGSTFLFQTALALLRLNETSLLKCDTAASVYLYLNSNMTHQGISIDGLIQASDSLRSQVKHEDVEVKREIAVKHELALTARERATSHVSGGPEEHAECDGIAVEYMGTPHETSASTTPPGGDDCREEEQVNLRSPTPSPPLAPWM